MYAFLIYRLQGNISIFLLIYNNKKNKSWRLTNAHYVHMKQFSRGQIVDIASDISDCTVFACVEVVGGTPGARLVVINPTSIFSFEPLFTTGNEDDDKSRSEGRAEGRGEGEVSTQGTLRSQRSLLEIGRVTFLKTESFTVHFKTSYGGDQVTYFYAEPLQVVGAIKDSLGKLGVKGKHTQNASNSSPVSQRRIQGGSFRERPIDAIRRLEAEMEVRPTLTIVRAIMDRYRRLIDTCVSDPSVAAQKEAERLMQGLQHFLMREDVTKTLNSESQILKQRERSEEEIVVERTRTRSQSDAAGATTKTT